MFSASEARPGSSTRRRVIAFDNGSSSTREDVVATEEPLEIRLRAGDERATVAVTMRTPGNDFELAAGFLFAEGVASEFRRIEYCTDPGVDQLYNTVTVELPGAMPDLALMERHFTMTSACGVCGKQSIESLAQRGYTLASGPSIAMETVYALPETLRERQGVFDRTGGLHAAGLFTSDGKLVELREDVGRHNALDKLLGWALMDGRIPLHDHVVLVSGRASYELVQKCLAASVPVMCAVGAPSSLAVQLADEFSMTLVGFVRDSRANVYSGAERIGS